MPYGPGMGRRNYLIEGVSGTGKTSVCKELRRRGYHAINGDTDLAYRGDPETGEPTDDVTSHRHHIWRVDRVRALVADQTEHVSFFRGGSISDRLTSSAHSNRNASSSCVCIEPKRKPRRTAS